MGLCLEVIYYSKQEVLKILSKIKPIILITHPKGSRKGFGDDKNKIKLPFHYGELPQYKNACDKMGWDIIIAPSSTLQDDLESVGVLVVNSDINEWKNRIPNSKKVLEENPVGNDKIIFAKDKKVTDYDKSILELFCNRHWQFERIDWL